MPELNTDRMLVSLLREVCTAREVVLTSFSNDWIFCLQKNDRVSYVFGYDFELNSATAKMLCKDKTATSDLLQFHRVPRVEHRIFHTPQMAAYVPITGNWDQMLAYFESCQRDVVCKTNEGTGGRDVTRARTPLELEAAVLQLFSKSRSLCLSPYIDIAAEYRVALLDSEVQFLYRKRRPSLQGDGRSSLRQLLLARLGGSPDFRGQLKGLVALEEMQLDFERVPAAGEEVSMNWRHNLGQGAVAEQLDPADARWRPICDIAVRAARALGVTLASVDIVESQRGLHVLEINCGIMMESLARSGEHGRALARGLYDRIVCRAMGLESA